MSRSISQRELRNDSGAVLREVEAGATLVVTRNGTPVAELRPVSGSPSAPGPRRYVPRADLVRTAPTAPRIDARRFRDDVDAVLDQRVDD